MNNKGKSNIIFILLMPVFFIVTIIFVDTMVSYNTTKTYKNVTENIIREVLENDEIEYEEYYDEIKKLYEKKNYETNMLVVTANEYKVSVDNEHSYFGLLSSLTNKNGEDTQISIFGIKFNVKKGSKTSISVEAKYNYDDELVFEYME